ncbi:hypothetical protein [Caldithrix abyssi]
MFDLKIPQGGNDNGPPFQRWETETHRYLIVRPETRGETVSTV